MPRALIGQLLLVALCVPTQTFGDDEHGGHGGGSRYYGFVDDFHANPSTTDATGEIFLTLNPARTELSYRIVFDELLGLKANPADRTEPDDITGIHLHLHVPDTLGPHVLNIFGWPGHEDADLVIDYDHRTLSGIYDISDASRDPLTGELYLQNLPLTTKVIDDWLDALDEGRLMLAVHTNQSGFSTMAIHGHISAIPEPSVLTLGSGALVILAMRRRWVRCDKSVLRKTRP
ncbi:MAG: CHRD domain-containing protein [Bythopirellula sp.]|nr:CHRD domain-containing protein [Bythopirellula sp.]